MEDEYKTKKQLINELVELRQQITDLELCAAKRNKLEADLNESMSKLSYLLEEHEMLLKHTRDFVYRHDTKGIFNYLSPAIETITGYKVEEWYKHYTTYMTDNPINKNVIEYTEDTLRTGKESPPYLVEIRHKDGRNILLEVNEKPYFKDGKVAGIIGVARDVTDRKHSEKSLRDARDNLEIRVRKRTAELVEINKELQIEINERKTIEDALRKSEERFRALTENTSDWIWEIDQNGVYTYASPKIKDLLGYETAEVIGKTPFYFMPQDEARQIAEIVHPIMKFKRPFAGLENKNLHKKGEIVILETSGTPILDAEGNLLGYRGIDRDITERKRADKILQESEERFRATFEQAAVGVAHVRPDGRFLLVNQKLCDIVGYTREELLKKTFQEITFPDDLDIDLKYVRKMLANEIQTYTLQKRYFHKDGSPVWINLTVSLVRKTSGEPVYFISVIEDISENKKLEAQLFQAQKMEAVGQLAGGIAHDFNNLLTAVIGYGNLLKTEVYTDNRLSSYVTQILSAAERAAHLTNNLLTFSRKQIIKPMPVDMNKIIREVEKMLSRIIGEDIELSTVLTRRELTIMADSTQIEQILMNLATNARDAMPDGGKLIISTEAVELDSEFTKAYGYGRPGMYALLSFEDTGIGMYAGTRERIFEPFFTTKAVGKGTGLGLAMVYGIVKQHDGYINVYSEPGRGTAFKIYLPLIDMKVEERMPADFLIVPTGTETVLIGEDDTQVRCLMKEMLLKAGYEILEAEDGEAVIRVFHENKDDIDLLILDVVMPKKNGKEVYDEIRKARSDIKVIFISGYSADVIHKKGILEQGLDFISKPVSPDDLLTKLREVLDK